MITTFTSLGYQPTDWGRLPLAIRQRWWQETDYGKNAPSDELKQAIKDVLIPKPVEAIETREDGIS